MVRELLVIALLGAACAPPRDLTGFDGGTGCENAGSRSLDEIWAKYLDGRAKTGCTASGCHGTGAGGLQFKTAAEFREATLHKPSAYTPGMALVAPGDLSNSAIFRRLLPNNLSRMPEGGPYLDDVALAEIAAWICAGAPAQTGADGGTDAGTPDAGETGPVVAHVEPGSGLVATPVVITGAGFSRLPAENAVAFNGTGAVVESCSETEIHTSVPPGATSGRVTVTVGGETGTSAADFQVIVPNPAPTLGAVEPTTLTAGGADATLTVTGSAFIDRSAVEWDGLALATTFDSGTKLRATVPAAKLEAAGDHAITVTNPGPGGGSTQPITLPVRNPPPTVSALHPTTVIAGSARFSLQITGTGFVRASAVSLNGAAAATTFVGATQLSAEVPAASLSSAGALAVVVTNPSPGGGASAAVTLSVVNPAPILSSVSPDSAAAGAGDVTLTLDGSAFVASSVVKLDGAALSTTFVSATRLTTAVSAASTSEGGTHELTVTNPAPGGGSSAPKSWSVLNPKPSITSLLPASIATNGAPFTLTVTGTGFVPTSTVSLDGALVATSFVSATKLEAQVGTIATAGGHAVAVTNPPPGGGNSQEATLTAATSNAPTITGLTPETAAEGAGFTLTVSGSGYACSGPTASAVLLGATPISPSTCSATQLTVAIGAQQAGSYSIKVRNGAGQASNAMTLSVVAPNPVPVLSAISPASAGQATAGFTLTVTGESFVAGAAVSFGGDARPTTFVSPVQLTATIPASDLVTAGTRDVVVANPAPGGGASQARPFQVLAPNPVPTVTALSPASVAAGASATNVSITGTGFVTSSQALWDGATRQTTFTSATQLVVALTASDLASAGTHGLSVRNPTPGGGTSGAFTFTIVAQNPVPVASSITPASATGGSGAFTLTVDGSAFVPGSAVLFDGAPKPTTFVSATRLTASIPGSDVATAGSSAVAVTSPSPGGGTSGSLSFVVTNPAPLLSSISPATVTVGSPAFTLTANGSGFTAASVVKADGAARTTRLVNSTQLSADLPAGDTASTGTRGITVVNPAPGGGTSDAVTLTVANQANPAPSISSLSPCGKVAGSGAFTLSINGSGFNESTSVTFGGTTLSVTGVTPSALTVSVPAAAIATAPAGGYATVTVSNPMPGGGTGSAVFGIAGKLSTLATHVQPIFGTNLATATCASSQCHAGSTPSEGLNLESGRAYAELVGVASGQCASRKLVLACDPRPTSSYLVAKILGVEICQGNGMPKPPEKLSEAQKQAIVDWVAQGAPP